ncbi:hypothetical protein B7Y94_01260 [Candidatus Saccharibacteria bacterium 32-49-12]|nr:MAG: hypothetical protein B7Y94_01260 [Candidatus Saccharibacteria bacterium 32-49-12]
MLMENLTGIGLLTLAIALGYAIARLPLIRRLFIPTSLAAGILLLILGPQIAGQYFPAIQIPTHYYDSWSILPKYMITLVFAGLFLGKPVLSPRKMWRLAGPQVAFGQTIAWGQYVVAGLLALFVLTPFFGMPQYVAALLEISFEGGHGTVAGMTPVFKDLDFEIGRQIATGLATASLISALIIGLILIHWGNRRGLMKGGGLVQVARNKVYHHQLIQEIRSKGVSFRKVVTPQILFTHVVLLLLGVAAGWAIHQGLLQLEAATWGRDGYQFFGYVPLFTFAMFGGMIAQILWRKAGLTIVREVIELITSFTLTLLIVTAVGTMSLEFLVSDAWVFVLLYLAGVLWILFAFFFLAKRIFRRYWFHNAIISFGQGMGMTATGLLFAQMVDPKNKTNAVEAFGYKQLMFEPLMGGGLVTALSMPIMLMIGVPLFTAICAIIMIFWLSMGLIYFGKRK